MVKETVSQSVSKRQVSSVVRRTSIVNLPKRPIDLLWPLIPRIRNLSRSKALRIEITGMSPRSVARRVQHYGGGRDKINVQIFPTYVLASRARAEM